MKEILLIKSNPYFYQEESEDFTLKARLEVVIIHTDGKAHKLTPEGLESTHKVAETRLIVSPELLQQLITDLQLHQKMLEGYRQNADQLNALVKHINSDKQ